MRVWSEYGAHEVDWNKSRFSLNNFTSKFQAKSSLILLDLILVPF